jgi:hypothetical protein
MTDERNVANVKSLVRPESLRHVTPPSWFRCAKAEGRSRPYSSANGPISKFRTGRCILRR